MDGGSPQRWWRETGTHRQTAGENLSNANVAIPLEPVEKFQQNQNSCTPKAMLPSGFFLKKKPPLILFVRARLF